MGALGPRGTRELGPLKLPPPHYRAIVRKALERITDRYASRIRRELPMKRTDH